MAPVDAVILAAGRSTRMARPKALLEIDQDTFLSRAAETLRSAGCRSTLLVVNTDAAEWAEEQANRLDLQLVVNRAAQSQQIDSLRLAVQRLAADTAAILVLPVDLPLIQQSTAASLIASFHAQPGPLILPFHNGVAGHPVLLGRELFAEILECELDEGIRTLIMAHARDLREVRVKDPGILVDIDTPDDYQRFVETR